MIPIVITVVGLVCVCLFRSKDQYKMTVKQRNRMEITVAIEEETVGAEVICLLINFDFIKSLQLTTVHCAVDLGASTLETDQPPSYQEAIILTYDTKDTND